MGPLPPLGSGMGGPLQAKVSNGFFLFLYTYYRYKTNYVKCRLCFREFLYGAAADEDLQVYSRLRVSTLATLYCNAVLQESEPLQGWVDSDSGSGF